MQSAPLPKARAYLSVSLDHFFHDASAALEQKTNGRYVIVFTAEASCEQGFIVEAVQAARRRLVGPVNPQGGIDVDSWVNCDYDWQWYDAEQQRCFRYVYMTPNILWGIIVGLITLIIGSIGLCCINDVQTPTVYMSASDPGPQKGKEF